MGLAATVSTAEQEPPGGSTAGGSDEKAGTTTMNWNQLGRIVLAVAVATIWPGPQIAERIRNRRLPEVESAIAHVVTPTPESGSSALPADWFESIKARCTPSEARIITDVRPPPPSHEGTAYKATCFALADDIPMARALILGLPVESHTVAAGILFDVTGATYDPLVTAAAGPLLELVLEFWPNHYLALFYAGSVRYAGGDFSGAAPLLERFLESHGHDDGWSNDARGMLDSIRGH